MYNGGCPRRLLPRDDDDDELPMDAMPSKQPASWSYGCDDGGLRRRRRRRYYAFENDRWETTGRDDETASRPGVWDTTLCARERHENRTAVVAGSPADARTRTSHYRRRRRRRRIQSGKTSDVFFRPDHTGTTARSMRYRPTRSGDSPDDRRSLVFFIYFLNRFVTDRFGRVRSRYAPARHVPCTRRARHADRVADASRTC